MIAMHSYILKEFLEISVSMFLNLKCAVYNSFVALLLLLGKM
jgi:hypothetical protein